MNHLCALAKHSLALIVVCLSTGVDAAPVLREQVLRLGPIDLTPSLTIGEGYNDNVFLINLDKQGSWFTEIRPSLKIGRRWNRLSLGLSYNLTDTRYVSVSQNDTTNHELSSGSQWVFNHRNKLDLSGSLFFGFYPLGTGPSQGIIPTANSRPVQYTRQSNQATYQFGADGAKGNLVFNAGYTEIHYDNQTTGTIPQVIIEYSTSDYYNINLGGTFLYKVMPKTQLLVEVDDRIVKYINRQGGNYSQFSYLLGVKWKAAGKTSGTIKLGIYDAQPDNKQFKTNIGFTGLAEVVWQPWIYSGFTLSASQSNLPSFGSNTGAYSNNKLFSLGWLHSWNHRLSSQLQLRAGTQDYVGTTPENNSTLMGATVGVNYQMRPWLSFGLNYTFNRRDSTITRWNYDQNMMLLNVNLAL
ncbi:MAG: outer membrane beta-barrel protein [Proteobacteria bacterium]|nr:outer membrane beta-barrel protein [Pseudomonadota bacterium]